MSWDETEYERLDGTGIANGRRSRMRALIAAGLVGVSLLGMLGGMLHILPA